jgi:hypothetical protein
MFFMQVPRQRTALIGRPTLVLVKTITYNQLLGLTTLFMVPAQANVRCILADALRRHLAEMG